MNANGIHPALAVILTLIVGALMVLLLVRGHIVWGIIFAVIFLDFLADAVLSFKKA